MLPEKEWEREHKRKVYEKEKCKVPMGKSRKMLCKSPGLCHIQRKKDVWCMEQSTEPEKKPIGLRYSLHIDKTHFVACFLWNFANKSTFDIFCMDTFFAIVAIADRYAAAFAMDKYI